MRPDPPPAGAKGALRLNNTNPRDGCHAGIPEVFEGFSPKFDASSQAGYFACMELTDNIVASPAGPGTLPPPDKIVATPAGSPTPVPPDGIVPGPAGYVEVEPGGEVHIYPGPDNTPHEMRSGGVLHVVV